MKICLIHPPIEDFYYTSIRRQPLGLLYIAASLKQAGHECALIHAHSPGRAVIPLPGQFAYLKSYMDHPDPALRFPFGNYCHYGLSFEEIRRKISASPADMFFISSLFTTYHEETERIIEIIKEKRPGAPIAAGGYHAALHPGHLLNECGADFVISGEGEAASVALADYVSGIQPLDSVPGLA